MSPEDYHALGFVGGLEIHQQLLTASKLFCRCPAGRYQRDFDAEILRHMRPTLSEMGEYDGTALMEFKTHKNIIYRTKQQTCCTYEMDDTPPFDMDPEAVDIGIQIALLLHCNLVSEMHIIRKQYLDGSIPTGFQRTAIVGVEGHFPLGEKRIGVKQLAVEEDSCRQISDRGHYRTYVTDRLGMPLLEIVTHPDLRTPFEMEAAGQILRRLTRGTGLVRSGAGAAREDVNVSIAGGTRAEIKGVSSLKMIPRLTHNEALRQAALLALRGELRNRGITKKTFKAGVADVSDLLRDTRPNPAANALEAGGRAFAVVLHGYAGILAAATQETKRFIDEISDRVRVIACLDLLPNIAADETTGNLLAAAGWRILRRKLGAAARDAVVLTWGPEGDARLAADEIVIRAREAAVGVPSETRQALADGTTGFERILPGPDRMYPDTDRPPIRITEERIARLSAKPLEAAWSREARYREWGVPEDCIGPLIMSRWAETFEGLVKKYEIDPRVAATLLMHRIKGWRRRGWPVNRLTANDVERVFALYRQGTILQEAVAEALARYLTTEQPLRQILNGFARRREAEKHFSESVSKAKRRLRKKTFRNGPAAVKRHAMGILMDEYRGLIPAAVVQKAIDEHIMPAFTADAEAEGDK